MESNPTRPTDTSKTNDSDVNWVMNVYDDQSTVRSRYVGQKCGADIEEPASNGNDMAATPRVPPSKVSRLFSGKRAASTEDVAALSRVRAG